MQEIGKLINEYGVSLVIVILFLYDWLTTRRDSKNNRTKW